MYVILKLLFQKGPRMTKIILKKGKIGHFIPRYQKSYTKEKVMMPNFSIANWTLKIVEQYLQNSKEKITFDL